MKFDYVIGNPPYQEDIQNKGDRANPVYDKFMEAAYEIGEVVELIHPARFLFNAGQTSKAWNKKMLDDEHFRVLHYEKDASRVFPNTDIKGGVAITIRDAMKMYGSIDVFSPYDEMNTILRKVKAVSGTLPCVDSIVSSRGMYRLSAAFYSDYPNAQDRVGQGSGNMIVSNIFDKIPEAFLKDDPMNGSVYYRILGRVNNRRVYRYLKAEYVISNDYIDKFKVLFPEANSSGQFGETLTIPEIGHPSEGATDTFINIGLFATENEASALIKYIKTKFLRALLGIKKATQHTPKSVWSTIPLQDFTPASDIDWTQPIPAIDQQLYHKYGLTDEEIAFIESHVKEMT